MFPGPHRQCLARADFFRGKNYDDCLNRDHAALFDELPVVRAWGETHYDCLYYNNKSKGNLVE